MRYIRQVVFENIGEEKQKQLEKADVVIVGIGALGTAACEMLVRSGVKNLSIIDRDIVELSNLQRQSLFSEIDIDSLKVNAAEKRLKEINSEVNIKKYPTNLDFDNINILKSNIILDCTDNFDTRFLLNDYAVKNKIPLVYCSVIGSTGMAFNILPKKPCLGCIFKEPNSVLGTCDVEGIINTIVHSMAAIQVTEAIKIITKQQPNNFLMHYNIWKNKLTRIKVNKNNQCKACSGNFDYLDGKNSEDTIKLCSDSSFIVKTKHINLNDLGKKLSKISDLRITPHCMFFKDMTIFNNRVIVKAETKEEAKLKVGKYIN